MGEMRNAYSAVQCSTVFLLEKLKGKNHSEDLNVDERLMLERILGE
jgi:hypothetical protein